ncbi:MAG: class I SAM-dependent methyltransferase [Actinomycetota bacterium]
MDQPQSIEISQLLEQIEAAVAARRQTAAYPPDLERDLAEHFERVQEFRVTADTPRPRLADQVISPLVSTGWFPRSRITIESKVPGGQIAHRAIGGITARQVQGALHLVEEYADAVKGVVHELASTDLSLSRTIENLHARVDALQSRLEKLTRRVETRLRFLGRDSFGEDPSWFDPIALEKFRGARDDIMYKYEALADRLIGKDPVLDFGCGRGDFLHLLAAREVVAAGVELDPNIAVVAQKEGLPVVCGDGFDTLAAIPAGELGGFVSLQVIEHMEREVLLHLIDEVRRVLRPGGLLVLETPNPRSLFVHASSFWLDATHVRLVDPEYLAMVCDMAGFGEVEIEYRSHLPEPTLLETDPDDNLATRNVLRLNEVVFAACDYAVIAVR